MSQLPWLLVLLQSCLPRCDTVVAVDRTDLVWAPEGLSGQECATLCEMARLPDDIVEIEEVYSCEEEPDTTSADVPRGRAHEILVSCSWAVQAYECKAL